MSQQLRLFACVRGGKGGMNRACVPMYLYSTLDSCVAVYCSCVDGLQIPVHLSDYPTIHPCITNVEIK